MLSPLYPFARQALFRLDAETAHHLTLAGLGAAGRTGVAGCLGGTPVRAPVKVMGLTFGNAVGLAAGLDKDGAAIDGLSGLGFGFIEVGTVTPRAQPGNPKPRMFRLPEAEALINRMGFNNAGVERFIANVQAARWKGILGLNIGKNATTPIERAVDDYLFCLDRVYAFASYVTINISSPNTKNLRQLQDAAALDALLGALTERRKALSDMHGKHVPLALKIAPDLDDDGIQQIADKLVQHGIDAVISGNTTVSRDAVQGLPHADEAGGLSGRPVREASTRVIAGLHARLQGAVPIIGVGGIFSAQDALEKLDAGASLVQLYSGLIYRGPSLIRECAAAIAARG